jgi:tetratricopeptide (TPR) repeat protein/transcriptional regulator with XRE-family HTH domain
MCDILILCAVVQVNIYYLLLEIREVNPPNTLQPWEESMVKKAAQATPNRLLRAARKERGWTQKDVADRIGAPQAFNISRWEHGTAFPSAHYVEQLCQLFGRSARELGLMEDEVDTQFEAPPPTLTRDQSTTIPSLWTVPYRRNPFFTGRQLVLKHLHNTLAVARAAALTQIQAISGLGGIGKTQIAVEYAYRNRDEYRYVLWVRAATRDSLLADFVTLADLLDLSVRDEQDQLRIVATVKGWLTNVSHWLLIMDNVDDLDLINDFVPASENGQILLTTRAQATGWIAPSIVVEQMDHSEGTLLLLRRAKLLAPGAILDQANEQDRKRAEAIVEVMGGLPLALDQAGAYIEETGCGLTAYQELLRTHRKDLLRRRSRLPSDHPESVAATWALTFRKVEQSNPAAADLLRLCAFLDPDTIPEGSITTGASYLGTQLGPIASDRFKLNEAIEVLRRFSLVRRDPEAKALNIHRLVQAVLKDSMDEQAQRLWAERTVGVVNAALPEVSFENWHIFQQYLPHAQVCAGLIDRYHFTSSEAARLLALTGWFLRERALFTQAESLLQRALVIQEQVLGPEHLDIASSLNNLARLYRDLGKNELSEPLLQRALAIQEQVLGPEHPQLASSLNNLGRFYHIQAQFENAELFYQRALTIRVQVLGPNHPDTVASFLNLLGIYYARGKYEQNEALLQQALAICEQELGPKHPSTANVLNGLAAHYYIQDELDKAEPLLQRALAIIEQVQGMEHPSTATIINNLAMLYYVPGKLEQAELLTRRALAIREQMLGPEHPSTAESLNNLAMLYFVQGKPEQAEPLVKRSLAINEKSVGLEHPFVVSSLNVLALIYCNYGKFGQAEPLLRDVMVLVEKVMGSENHFTALGLNNLAMLYCIQGKYAEAESLYQRILTTCEHGLVPDPLDVAVYLENYAHLLRMLKRGAELAKQDGAE